MAMILVHCLRLVTGENLKSLREMQRRSVPASFLRDNYCYDLHALATVAE